MRRDIADYILECYRKVRPRNFNQQMSSEKKENLLYEKPL